MIDFEFKRLRIEEIAMNILELKKSRRIRRKYHIRKRINGSSERPRLSVFRSHKHIYAQIIDDETMRTICQASTKDKELREMLKPEMPKKAKSELVGELLAKRAIANDVKKVAFDRNAYLYHGRVKALAEACRKAGLEF